MTTWVFDCIWYKKQLCEKIVFWSHSSRANLYKNTCLNTFAILSKTLQNYTFVIPSKSLQKFSLEQTCRSEKTGTKTNIFSESTCKILVLTSCLLPLQMSIKIPCYPYFYSQQQIEDKCGFYEHCVG